MHTANLISAETVLVNIHYKLTNMKASYLNEAARIRRFEAQ
jgi:hypothetical protein